MSFFRSRKGRRYGLLKENKFAIPEHRDQGFSRRFTTVSRGERGGEQILTFLGR